MKDKFTSGLKKILSIKKPKGKSMSKLIKEQKAITKEKYRENTP